MSVKLGIHILSDAIISKLKLFIKYLYTLVFKF